MLTVEIWNYKTIEHVRMSFEGFATIQGKNFIGKSAILGALRSCLTNTIDKSSVRRGADHVDVRIIHDHSDLDCYWHYEEGNTFYIINKQEYTKLNGAIPPPLIDKGFGPISAGEEKIHFWDVQQFKSLFLVDKGRSNFATDILSSIFKIDSVYKAKDLCDKDIKSNRASIKIRKQDLRQAEEALSALSDVPRLSSSVKDVSAALESLKGSARGIAKYSSLLDGLKKAQEDVACLESVGNIPSVVAPVTGAQLTRMLPLVKSLGSVRSEVRALYPISNIKPHVSSVVETKELWKRMSGLLGGLKECSGKVRALMLSSSIKPVSPPAVSLEKVRSLSLLLSSVKRAELGIRVLQGLHSVGPVRPVSVAPEDLIKARNLLASVKVASKEYKALVPAGSLKKGTSGAPQYDNVLRAKKLLLSLTSVQKDITALEKDLGAALTEKESVALLLKNFGSCPLCGNDVHEGLHV